MGPAKKGKKQPNAALDPTNPAPNPVTLYKNAIEPPLRLTHEVLVPHNIKDQFFSWEKELLGASMVNIHSKVIVLDPFGDNPVVMTGSHNLGFKASSENDDNLAIIEGNAPLAAAYAINIIAIFQNYRWNNYVEMHRKDPKVWHGLVDNDQWQSGYLTGSELAELNFWLAAKPKAAAAVAASSGPTSSATAPASASGQTPPTIHSVSTSPSAGGSAPAVQSGHTSRAHAQAHTRSHARTHSHAHAGTKKASSKKHKTTKETKHKHHK